MAKKFWAEYLPFPYGVHSEAVDFQYMYSKFVHNSRCIRITIFLAVYAALIYATSTLSYLRNKDQLCMEPIFHDDLLEDPLKAVLSLCVKLDIEAKSLLENTLLPNSPEVKILFVVVSMRFTLIQNRQKCSNCF